MTRRAGRGLLSRVVGTQMSEPMYKVGLGINSGPYGSMESTRICSLCSHKVLPSSWHMLPFLPLDIHLVEAAGAGHAVYKDCLQTLTPATGRVEYLRPAAPDAGMARKRCFRRSKLCIDSRGSRTCICRDKGALYNGFMLRLLR